MSLSGAIELLRAQIASGGAIVAPGSPADGQGLNFLPSVNFSTGQKPVEWMRGGGGGASRSSLNGSAKPPSERTRTLAAENTPIPVSYGRDLFGARRVNVLSHGGFWVVRDVWCEGPIDGIESVLFGDEPMPAAVQAQHYTGVGGQGVDPWLAEAFAAQGVTYTDTLPGIAYSVFKVPASVETWDSVSALRRGLRVYDPRSGLTGYSQNPALWLADFLTNAVYGAGRGVNWASVAAAADYCDELVGGAARRTGGGLTLDTVQPVDDWVEVLRTYAGCLRPVLGADGAWWLVPDRPAATVASYSHAAGNVQAVSPLRRRGRAEAPTVVRVLWTDTTVTPWAERTAVAQLPGVSTGAVPRREQEVRLAGLHSYAQALREATQRLNQFTLADLSFSVDLFDAAVAHQPGDVIEITYPMGLTDKPMRVVGIEGGLGRYRLDLVEYDPAVYSNEVVTEPTFDDVVLPSPLTIPEGLIADLTMTEELFRLNSGGVSSRFRVTWAAAGDWPYLDSYYLKLHDGTHYVWQGPSRRLDANTGAVEEGKVYTIEVHPVSTLGNLGEPAVAERVALGKVLPPSDVPYLTIVDDGNFTALEWGEAYDIDPIRYELRWGAGGVEWDDAEVLVRTSANSHVTKEIPEGAWDVLIKAADAGNRFSVNATRTSTALAGRPIPPESLAIVEELYQRKDGTYSSHIKITWAAPDFPNIAHYAVAVEGPGGVVATGNTVDAEFVTAAVEEGVTYTVFVRTVAKGSNAVSVDAAVGTVTVQGKLLPPSDVPSLTGYEVGGQIRLFWEPAIDIDIWRYEIRYGTPGVTWAVAKVIDRTDALRLVTNDVPMGTWDLLIKAIDSVGNYSPNATRLRVVVTLDNGAFLVDTVEYDTPSLTNMHEYRLGRLDAMRRFVTTSATSWDTAFPNAMSTYAGAVLSYFPATSQLLTESYDYGISVSGNWRSEVAVTDLSGAHTSQMEVSPDGTTWAEYPGLVAKTDGRFSRVRLSTAGVMSVVAPPLLTRVDVVPREEAGSVAAASSGGTLVQLSQEYAFARSVQMTVNGSTSRTAVYDRLLVAPATGLVHEAVSVRVSGGAYSFREISSTARVILSDDYLEYDVFVINDAAGARSGGFDITFTDGTRAFTPSPPPCVLGTGSMYELSAVAVPLGVWKSRRIPLSAFAGKTTSRWITTLLGGAPGLCKAVYRNIRVTNGGGTTRLTIWNGGNPALNADNINAQMNNRQCGPSNSMLAYVFDQSGTQVAANVSYLFKGV